MFETTKPWFRQSKLRPSLDRLAIVCCLLSQPAPDWRSFYYQTTLLQSGAGRANKHKQWPRDQVMALSYYIYYI